MVRKVASIKFTGNVTPRSWFKHPTLRSAGRPNLVAITLLADLIYWYRPAEDTSGKVLRQKFDGDKFQMSHARWADSLGLTKRQVEEGVRFLRERGVITTELRTVFVGGVPHNNVLFIEPVVTTLSHLAGEGLPSGVPGSPTPACQAPTPERGTYTETTAETTTEINPAARAAVGAEPANGSTSITATPGSTAKRPAGGGHPLHPHLVAEWDKRYAARHGMPYTAWGRGGKAAKEILNAIESTPGEHTDETTWARVTGIVSRYLADPDPFVVRLKHPLHYLADNLPRWFAGEDDGPAGSAGGEFGERPKPRALTADERAWLHEDDDEGSGSAGRAAA